MRRVVGDVCTSGMKHGEEDVRKPTAFMTNATCIAEALGQRCKGEHRHVPCCAKVAKGAEAHPDELCSKTAQGLKNQMKNDGRLVEGGNGSAMWSEEMKDTGWQD